MTVEVTENPLFVKITHSASGAEATVSLIGATGNIEALLWSKIMTLCIFG